MKVLLVLDSVSFGGAENLLVPLSKAAASAGFTFNVVTVAPQIPAARHLLPVLEAEGIHVEHLDIPRLLHPQAVPRLVSAIRASGCDLVHAHLESACTLTPIAAALTGRPSLCTFHHVPEPLEGRAAWRERLSIAAAGRSSGVLFVSEASRRAFAAKYSPRANWKVVHNGIDLDAFSPDGARAVPGLDLPAGAPVVVLVAAMRRPKGHVTAVAAWPEVLSNVPEARLLLVGAGEEEPALRAQVTRLKLDDSVLFLGVRHDIPVILRAADLAILPSHTEALPTTLMEAAACGVPAVATDVGGVHETVDDGRTGLLVPPRDTGALAAAVGELLLDHGRRVEMGRSARVLAEERFDMHAWARSLRGEYERALLRRSSARTPTSAP